MKERIYEQRAIVRILDAGKLADRDHIENFIINACLSAGLNIILGPISVNYIDDKDDDKSGISAIAIFAESSISVHTWPQKAYGVVDLFSCKEFDVNDLVDVVEFYFSPTDIEVVEVN